MNHISGIIAVLFTLAFSASAAYAEEFIECKFFDVKDGDNYVPVKILKRDDGFYLIPNDVEGVEGKLALHAPSSEEVEKLAMMNSIMGIDDPKFGPKITFIELLGSGGVNTTTINFKTKEGWHSRHTALLQQFKGKCETNLF